MHRLVYYSSNRIPGPTQGIRAQIDQILETSRRNNQQVGITGALMFSSNFFGQILEGTRDALETTFERIQQDSRHGNVSLLDFSAVENGSFAGWEMAFVGDADGGFNDWNNTGFDFETITGEVLFAKLHELVRKTSRSS